MAPMRAHRGGAGAVGRMRSLTFDPLPTCGFIQFRGLRAPLVHPAHRYRQLGRDLIRDCFQRLPEDLPWAPTEWPDPER